MPAKYHIEIYHNNQAQPSPYAAGHKLTLVLSYEVEWYSDVSPNEQIADWAAEACTTDPDRDDLNVDYGYEDELEEHKFRFARTYRAACAQRTFALGDVVRLTRDGQSSWLIWGEFGWRATEPSFYLDDTSRQ